MSNLPLGDDLKQIFDDITSGRTSEPPLRAILVQNDNGVMRLVDSLPPEGTDKDDFSSILGKLFAKEPNRPGYALFRLDTKSPAGLYEWLNCAFRPDGARVRDKMQYAVTQASLFHGLSEQHFLETVYGATVNDFSFPKQLRNARKHDYQNPQLSTKGKSAAEAAGTNAGGARRNFESVNTAVTPTVGTAASQSDQQQSGPQASSVSALRKDGNLQTISSSPIVDQAQPQQAEKDSAVAEDGIKSKDGVANVDLLANSHIKPTESEPPRPPEEIVEHKDSAEATEGMQSDNVTEGERELAEGIAQGEGVDVHLTQPPSQKDATVSETPKEAPQNNEESTSLQTDFNNAKEDSNIESAPEIAPVAVAVAEKAREEDAKPLSGVESTAPATKKADPVSEPSPVRETQLSTPIAAAANTASTSNSVGVGRGVEGLSTERERQLADVKAQEAKLRAGAASSAGTTGGARTGFSWHDDVHTALQAMASSSVNVIVLRVDLSKEEVQVASQSSDVEPDALAATLTSVGEKSEQSDVEPSYVLYVHPQAQQTPTKGVGVIYVCPLSCTVRQRMMYSTNMIKLCKGIDSFEGLSLVKRVETADVKELTSDVLHEAFVQQEDDGEGGAAASQGAASFTRPKRPGRK